MKTTILFFFLCIMFTTCMNAQDRNLKKFKPEKNMVALDFLKGNVTLKPGQKAYLQYTQHGSVGLGGELEIADNAIVKVVKEHTAYEKAHVKGMTGDDKATVTLVIEALEAGETDITFKKIFRGTTEEENTINITVK